MKKMIALLLCLALSLSLASFAAAESAVPELADTYYAYGYDVGTMFMNYLMNAFNSIPKEMYEASHIDGAGHLSTLFEITLPQAMNMGSVIILNLVIGQWNSWLPASIYVPNKKAMWPLQLVIRQITSENAGDHV